MTLYKPVLELQHNRDLCAQTIITQNNFYKSVHVDMDAQVTLNKEEIYLKPYTTHVVKEYIDIVTKITNGQLPKSTTCCWSLRNTHSVYIHAQYFVGLDACFAYLVSSDSFENPGVYLGGNFHSSLFCHCTSLLIWIDNEGMYHMSGPNKMYNFSWGSDGSSK